MKILVADDHDLVREGLRHALVRLDEDVSILEAQDLTEVLEISARHGDLDLILLDLTMPGINGLDGLRRLRERSPTTPVVVLSAMEEPEIMREAIRLGAKGYIPKSSPNPVMLSAVRLVLSGGVYLPLALLNGVEITGDSPMKTGQGGRTPREGKGNRTVELTGRQLEVLSHLVEGKTNKEIGAELGLSEATVRTHVTAIFRELHVSNRTQASRVAAGLGLGTARNDDLPKI